MDGEKVGFKFGFGSVLDSCIPNIIYGWSKFHEWLLCVCWCPSVDVSVTLHAGYTDWICRHSSVKHSLHPFSFSATVASNNNTQHFDNTVSITWLSSKHFTHTHSVFLYKKYELLTVLLPLSADMYCVESCVAQCVTPLRSWTRSLACLPLLLTLWCSCWWVWHNVASILLTLHLVSVFIPSPPKSFHKL